MTSSHPITSINWLLNYQLNYTDWSKKENTHQELKVNTAINDKNTFKASCYRYLKRQDVHFVNSENTSNFTDFSTFHKAEIFFNRILNWNPSVFFQALNSAALYLQYVHWFKHFKCNTANGI